MSRWKELPPHLASRVHYDSGPARIPESTMGKAFRSVTLKGSPASRKMNTWEHQYSVELDLLRAAGEIIDWHWESVKLRLASGTWYKADFDLLMPSGRIRLVEVKGHMEDDAAVKIKVAAEQFPGFEFVLVTRLLGLRDFVSTWSANMGALRKR